MHKHTNIKFSVVIFIKNHKNTTIKMEFIDNGIQFIVDLLSGLVNKIIIALIIILIGFIIAKILSRIIHKTLKQVDLDKMIKEISGIKVSFEEIISHFVLYFIYFISIVLALRYMNIATDILNILSGVVILIIGIFILLSVKDFIPNIISGIIIHQKCLFKKGDIISVNNITGEVIDMTLLDTKLTTKSGDTIIIPNSTLTKTEFIKKKSSQKRLSQSLKH